MVDASANIYQSSTPVTIGDSAYIGIDFTTNTNDSFSVSMYIVGQPHVYIITKKVSQIASQLTYTYNNGNTHSATKIKFSIPNVPSGHYNLGVTCWGNAGLYNSDPNYLPDVMFDVNNTTGITQYNHSNELISIEYYNLLGQPIKQPEGITVEIKTYLGGYKEVRKIITCD